MERKTVEITSFHGNATDCTNAIDSGRTRVMELAKRSKKFSMGVATEKIPIESSKLVETFQALL